MVSFLKGKKKEVNIPYLGREKWVPPHTEWVGRAPYHPAAYKDTAAPHPGIRYGRAELVDPCSYNEAPMSCIPNVGKLPVIQRERGKMKLFYNDQQVSTTFVIVFPFLAAAARYR